MAASTSPTRAAGVTVERTGGIAGVEQSITVAPDGRWSYHQDRPGQGGVDKPVRGRLNEMYRADLQALLADPALATETGGKADCADGFGYKLVTGATLVEWTDCGGDGPPTASRVVALLTESTPF